MPRFDDDDDDFTPRKNTRVSRDDDDEEPAPKQSRRRDEDEDADEPAPAKRTIKRGWAAAEAIKSNDTSYAQKLKLEEEPVLIKFLEDDPYASYRQHWLPGRNGQKSFTCIADTDPKGCPLCENGNRSATRISFNVALLAPGEEPQIKSYDVGTRVMDQLKTINKDTRQGPLTKHYWSVHRTGKGTSSSTNLQMVKERDLEEEWNIEPLTEVELKSLSRKVYDEDIIPIPTRKELISIATEDD